MHDVTAHGMAKLFNHVQGAKVLKGNNVLYVSTACDMAQWCILSPSAAPDVHTD